MRKLAQTILASVVCGVVRVFCANRNPWYSFAAQRVKPVTRVVDNVRFEVSQTVVCALRVAGMPIGHNSSLRGGGGGYLPNCVTIRDTSALSLLNPEHFNGII